MDGGRRGRVPWPLAVGLVGAVALLVYPPMQLFKPAALYRPADEGTERSSLPPVDPATGERVWDAESAAWAWAQTDVQYVTMGYRPGVRVFGPRLLAQLGLWAAVVWAMATVGRRAAAWPGPRWARVRWAAIAVAGFAVANVGLALALGSWDSGVVWKQLGRGRVMRAAETCWDAIACWGYGFLLPYSVAVWVAAAWAAYVSGPPPTRWTADDRTLGWVGGVRPWPAEHWLGGPAKPSAGGAGLKAKGR